MQVVQVRGKSESFDSALDVVLDMRCGISDRIISLEDLKATFRRDCRCLISLTVFPGDKQR